MFQIVFLALSLIVSHQVDAFMAPSPLCSTSRQRSLRNQPSPTALRVFSTAIDTQATMTAIDSFFQTQPYIAAFLTCSFKASAADLVAQNTEDSQSQPGDDDLLSTSTASFSVSKDLAQAVVNNSQESPPDIDIARNLGFLLFGGLYTGMAQTFFYTQLYPELFRFDSGWTLVTKEVMLDNLVFGPLLCLPVAYSFKALFTSGDVSLKALRDGLAKYIEDVSQRGLLTKYWMIWVPVQFLTFGVIPSYFQSTFVAFFSFFWMTILSYVSSETND